MDAKIPFSGFYESKWSKGIDDEEEQYFEHLREEHSIHADDMQALHEWMWRNSKYHKSYETLAQEYVEPFQNFINEALGMKIKLSFLRMTSPKYYNFETDHLHVDISLAHVRGLYKRIGMVNLRKAAKAMFTSHDGFISHYPNDVDEWPAIPEWDCNHIYCLFYAAGYVIESEADDWEWSIYEAMSENGDFSNAFHEAFDNNDLLLEVGRLIGAREKQEEFE